MQKQSQIREKIKHTLFMAGVSDVIGIPHDDRGEERWEPVGMAQLTASTSELANYRNV
jgi:hypothetical protein